MDPVIKRRVTSFGDAVASLCAAIAAVEVTPEFRRDTALLRFQLAAEFAPKVTRQVLSAVYSVEASVPREVFRESLQARLVSEADAEILLKMVGDRNRMVHDYNERYADSLLDRVSETYAPALVRLHGALDKAIALSA